MGISRPKTGASRIKDRKAGKTFTTHRKGKKPGSIIKISYFYPKAKKTAPVPPSPSQPPPQSPPQSPPLSLQASTPSTRGGGNV